MSFLYLKVEIFALSCLFLLNAAIAQINIGFSVGTNQNKLDTKFLDQSTSIKEGQGINFNSLFQYKANELISAEILPGILQKNYTIKYSSGAYQYFKNTYIEVPVLLQFDIRLSNKVCIIIDAGLSGAYWVYGKTKGLIPNVFNISDSTTSLGTIEYIMLEYYEGKYAFDNTRDNRFEFDWLVSTGASYQINKQDKLFFKSEFQRAFSSQQKVYMLNQLPRYNQTGIFSIGVIYRL